VTPLLLVHDVASASFHWDVEVLTAAMLTGSALAYAAGLGRLWARAGAGAGIRAWEAGCFYAGLGTLAGALLSPLASISEALFSWHMTQHELLMLVAAPLLVAGRPLLVFLWALPSRRRDTVAAIARRPFVATGWRALTGPAVAFVLHGITIWIWHAPALFEGALRHDAIHWVQHASFVLTATLFWWGIVHGRYGRMGYGAAVVYVFLTAVHTSILGALLTISPSPWYAAYRETAPAWQVDALADQQAAGLIMWVPSGAIFIAIGLALMAAWLGESERRARLQNVR
jgi:putative membrane protein